MIDVVAVLTESARPRKYWDDLKRKLQAEGSELSEKIGQLKLLAPDGKKRVTDVADVEQLFRLIQSIPSPKAEPFKLWLAQLGRERLDETTDPELSIDRAIQNYRRLGYPESWINQRIKSIEIRKGLTDEWDRSGVKQEGEYAILTDLMTKTWSGMTTKEYRRHKDLKQENLRDNMTNLELVINMLAEATATELSANEMNEKSSRKGSKNQLVRAVCRNCGTATVGRYCHVCGQDMFAGRTHRLLELLDDSLGNIFAWDNKVFRTLWNLIAFPGRLTREFYAGRIIRYVFPSKLLWFITIIFFALLWSTAKIGDEAPITEVVPAADSIRTESVTTGPAAVGDAGSRKRPRKQ